MRFSDIKVGMMVQDSWWPLSTYGRVIEVLKTVIKVDNLRGEIITYDKSHCQFLEKFK